MSDSLTLKVNGLCHELNVDSATPLVLVLRNELGLTAAKLGCGLEQCGACAVLVDGVSTLSCASPVGQFEGCEITTLEGLAERTRCGAALQQAFIDTAAAQCGYCTGGILVALGGLFETNERPSDSEVRAALDDHLCRCGSHARVLAAAKLVAGDGGNPTPAVRLSIVRVEEEL